MAVPLEGHQLVDVHRPELGDAADVIAGEVDEHHVLGPLLGMLGQFGGHPAIVLVCSATATRARDRARDHLAIEELHHRLGTRPHDRQLGMAHEVHVRRRVHLSQHAVDVERIGAEREVVALREHDLEDIAGDDVFLGHLDRLLVHPVGHGRVELREFVVCRGRFDRCVRQRFGQIGDRPLDADDGPVVGLVDLGAGQPAGRHTLDEVHPLPPVIEGGERSDHRHHRVGELPIVGRDVGEVFHLAYDVVTQEAHDPSVERG